MDKSNEFNQNSETRSIQIWCCEKCEAVHFKSGNVLLNFTKTEFTELAYNINDVFQNEFGSLEFYHLISSLGDQDDVLSSSIISLEN